MSTLIVDRKKKSDKMFLCKRQNLSSVILKGCVQDHWVTIDSETLSHTQQLEGSEDPMCPHQQAKFGQGMMRSLNAMQHPFWSMYDNKWMSNWNIMIIFTTLMDELQQNKM